MIRILCIEKYLLYFETWYVKIDFKLGMMIPNTVRYTVESVPTL